MFRCWTAPSRACCSLGSCRQYFENFDLRPACAQVLDSPFARLRDLMVELTEEQRLPIPRAFMRVALGMMRRSVRKRAKFSIDDVSPLDVVGQSYIPALFGARPRLHARTPTACVTPPL